jgi:membrane-associated phospholipid phosphatase
MPEKTTTRWRGALALQDVIVIGYALVLAVLWWARAPAPGPGPAIRQVYACLALVPAAAFVAREVPEVPWGARINVYRVVVVGAIVWGYLILRDALPVIRTDTVDASLAAADARIFGGEPVLWLEALNRRPVVEWMSFFYFNYYTLLLAHVVGALWIARSPRVAAEFGVGTALIFCAGHLGYMAVPAYGPVSFFADRFRAPLDGGLFWGLVSGSVEAGGAMKDVFPSMHTGATAWLALFAVRQATLDRRWRVPAALTCFCAANIALSTLVLRWHYVVDVLAGLTLASLTLWASVRLARWEEARRSRLGLGPVWPRRR